MLKENPVPEYERITPEYGPLYKIIEASRKAGQWMCDSVDHNEDTGCSNPECFKFTKG